jgi:hypothetical protein
MAPHTLLMPVTQYTTPEVATRLVAAIQARLSVVVRRAEETAEAHPTLLSRHVS